MTDTISEQTFEGNYDIVILNRMLANITPNQMVEWRKKYGFKLIVDNDDYVSLVKTSKKCIQIKMFSTTSTDKMVKTTVWYKAKRNGKIM